MNESSNFSSIHILNKKSPLSIKHLDSKTKANSFVTNFETKSSIVITPKSTATDINLTNLKSNSKIKSLKNNFVNNTNKKPIVLPVKSPKNLTTKSTSRPNTNRVLNNNFMPNYQIASPFIKKESHLQTSFENKVKPIIKGNNLNTHRGTLRQTSMTNNSNQSISSLKPSERRITEIYTNNPITGSNKVSRLVKQVINKQINDMVLSPKRKDTKLSDSVSGFSRISKSLVTSPREAKIQNLKSALFGHDKVMNVLFYFILYYK